jgi:Tol biopolymer transport system component
LLNLVDGTGRTLDAPQGWQLWSVLAWSGDGTRLAVATGDPAPGAAEEIGLAIVTVAVQPSWSVPNVGVGWNGSTNAVALSPDGTQIALSQDGELRVAPVEGGSVRILMTGIGRADPQVAWSPDGERIAVIGFPNSRGETVGTGNGTRYFQGRYVEVATGNSGIIEKTSHYEFATMLGFSGNSHVLLLVSESGEGPHTFVRIELTTALRSTVTRLSEGIDPHQISAAAAFLDDPPRSSTQPHDVTWAIAPVVAVAALVALMAVLVIGRLWRRHALR